VLDHIDEYAKEKKEEVEKKDQTPIQFDLGEIHEKGILAGKVRVIKGVKMLIYRCLRSGYSEIAVLIECYDVRGVLIAGQTVFADSDIGKIREIFTPQIEKEYDDQFGSQFPENIKSKWVEKNREARIDKHRP